MFLGAALIFGALFLFVHNRMEERRAMVESANLLAQLHSQIEQDRDGSLGGSDPAERSNHENIPKEFLDPSAFEMTEVEIDGYSYIGYLRIPDLELELPIMGDWDYVRLQRAPCRYMGSLLGDDLVLMAHNYSSHFGRLSELSEGASVRFTDMDGTTTSYKVVGKDILDPYAVEEMTSGDFDLTLFTCTYGGASRVTVYCDRVQ